MPEGINAPFAISKGKFHLKILMWRTASNKLTKCNVQACHNRIHANFLYKLTNASAHDDA